ncbi:PcfJ domain-containing protein [Neiella marina]|uniref:PcfJ domain-containing protein n=1 Tax=Neiella holothuriorum TaxID=2870530 RepID=A0ABS7EDH8_9GAMM|nr:PcfJ domain-containing protein [Neiella holothuriorum]MBW8190320.1 PcfJ domain-containing protein [Neiella holothuriorum]
MTTVVQEKQINTSSLPSVMINTALLGYDYDIQIMSWTEGLTAYQRNPSGSLTQIDGGVGVGLTFIDEGNDKTRWMSSIPDGLLEQTALFPEHQLQMLWLAANSKNAEDILLVRPFMLAMICESYRTDNQSALRLARLGQRQLLAELGLASTKAALKFIDKLTLTFEGANEIYHVMRMLNATTCFFKRFSHYTSVNFACLSLDNTHPFLTGTHLGRTLAETNNATRLRLKVVLVDTLLLGQDIGLADPLSVIVNLTTYDALQNLHDEWVRRRNLIRAEQRKPIDADKPYPVYFCSAPDIEPIVDYYDLCKEGDEMCHCVAVYHNRIAQGRYIVLRLSQPERMTIGIKIDPNKQFPYEIDQISGLKNKIPSEDTRKKVFDWLLNERKNYKLFKRN